MAMTQWIGWKKNKTPSQADRKTMAVTTVCAHVEGQNNRTLCGRPIGTVVITDPHLRHCPRCEGKLAALGTYVDSHQPSAGGALLLHGAKS